MWRKRVSREVAALDHSIPATDFRTFAGCVDDLCARHLSPAAGGLGLVAAKLFLLKISNLLIAKYEHAHRHVILISHPVGLLVDPSNGCGLKCPGCVHSGKQAAWDWPPGLLKEEVFRAFLDEHGPFAFELYLANYGEPLLNPLTPRFVQLARQYALPTFTSSSLSVPPRLVEGLVESGLNFLIMSIDGATDAVYTRYRRNGNFDQAIGNVRHLVETKRRLGSYTPVLHWQFLVFEHNFHEVEKVTQLAHDLGVDQLALIQPFDVDWDDPCVRTQPGWKPQLIKFRYDRGAYRAGLRAMRTDLAAESIDAKFAVRWTDRLAARAASPDGRWRAGAAPSLPKPCNWLYKSLTMDAHGRIMPCARPPSKSNDLVFSRHSRQNQFNSPRHQLARQMFVDEALYREQAARSDEPPPYCDQCEHRDQKADIDTQETVRRLLHDVDLYDALDAECKDALTAW